MQKILKILGKRGRVTIPWEIRGELGFACNDVISFERTGDAVLVRREKLCDGCITVSKPKDNATALTELLEDATPEEIRTALIQLSVRWAELQARGDKNA